MLGDDLRPQLAVDALQGDALVDGPLVLAQG